MKISVSLPEEDLSLLDDYARSAGLPSRSAALHRAIAMLRLPGLEDDYAEAWSEWERSGESQAWESTTGDGRRDAQG
ncbi:MAG TPA: ribbon-helix-helix domain-containing protein [Nocardioidaceae bacterium]|nr:ribbon-helix-helix domain-containing protein [Nocardioidaceae bacterium]